jgi:hypothetical protein
MIEITHYAEWVLGPCDVCGGRDRWVVRTIRAPWLHDDLARCLVCEYRLRRAHARSLRNTFACKSGRGPRRRNGRIVARTARLWRV